MNLKQMVAAKAVEEVKSGMVLGLGTGSTTRYAIEMIGQRLREGRLKDIVGVPTSSGSAQLARQMGIPLTTLQEHPVIDLTIDGADEVDRDLNLIKGGGGALLKEKIVAQASKRNVIIVDESKLSERVGTKWPVPVEVIPFGLSVEVLNFKKMGIEARIRKKGDGSPFITDEGNYILDCFFGPLREPQKIEEMLHGRAAIVENGLFLKTASEIIIGSYNGIKRLSK